MPQRLEYPGGCLLIITRATLSFYAKEMPYRWVMIHSMCFLHPVIRPDILPFIVRRSSLFWVAMYYFGRALAVPTCPAEILRPSLPVFVTSYLFCQMKPWFIRVM